MPSGVLEKYKPSPPAERAQKELRRPIWPPLLQMLQFIVVSKRLPIFLILKNIGKRLIFIIIFNLLISISDKQKSSRLL
ncbi:hypothetical protein B9T31_11290 [Acinetobacter sp. ANC 4558]|nr:hypothetical protein B9T31_11290 [Acinetobacter sp. ANC 4558]